MITGAYGGHTIDFRQLRRRRHDAAGTGRRRRATASIDFAADLADSLADGDAAYATFLDMVDAHVARHGLDMPQEPAARTLLPDPPCVAEPLRRLDLAPTASAR